LATVLGVCKEERKSVGAPIGHRSHQARDNQHFEREQKRIIDDAFLEPTLVVPDVAVKRADFPSKVCWRVIRARSRIIHLSSRWVSSLVSVA